LRRFLARKTVIKKLMRGRSQSECPFSAQSSQSPNRFSVFQPRPKVLFSAEEMERILAQPLQFGLKGIRDRAILETLFASGVRRGELLPVQIEDVDFEKQLLRVNHGKGRKERIVPISQRVCEWLAVYISKVRPAISFVDSGNTLFLANNGKAYIALHPARWNQALWCLLPVPSYHRNHHAG
jgi:site-specific recombinase XerD